MSELLQICGFFALSFGCAFGAAWLWAAWRHARASAIDLPDNVQARMSCQGEMYRARLLSSTPPGLRFSAPMQRGHYVPIREGSSVAFEAPTARGVLRFRSVVLARESEDHSFVVARPRTVTRTERRASRRVRGMEGLSAWVDGEPARVLNLSSCGARVDVARPQRKGSRVLIRLPWREEPLGAWVLDDEPGSSSEGLPSRIRVRFEQVIPLGPALETETPA